MEQHPIPQNISAYKFRLVGDMTLKQFAELAVGLVAAWAIFSSSLNFFIKWLLGPLAGFFGFALAFLPVEDRPLDQWIISFFKSIYRPTQFIYQSQPKPLPVFNYHPSVSPPVRHQTSSPTQLDEYLQSLPPSPATSFELAEKRYLEHIRNLFGALGTNLPQDAFTKDAIPSPPTKLVKSPVKGVRIRKLLHPQMCLLPHTTPSPPPEPTIAAMPIIVAPKPQPKPVSSHKIIPPSPIPQKAPPPKPLPSKPAAPAQSATSKPSFHLPPKPSSTPLSPSVKPAVFDPHLTLPFSVNKPNLISGITLDKNNKIIPSVILEIKNSSGYSVRALKSNKLGQFFIATPLPDGVYQVTLEHPDHRFDIIKFEAKGEIIPPLKIQSL